MSILVLRTNAGQATEVLIPDAGVIVPASGVPVTFESLEVLFPLAESLDLVALAQDDAFGVGNSTIIVNDGTVDIAQDFVDEFLYTVFLTRTGPYDAVVRDSDGQIGDASEIIYDPSATGMTTINVQDTLDEVDVRLDALEGGGGGITEAQHAILRQLIHLADGVGGPMDGFASGAFREVTGTLFPTEIVWYTSAAKTDKIVDKTITWTGIVPTTIQWRAYDTDGVTIVATVTDTITYNGVFEVDRTRSIT